MGNTVSFEMTKAELRNRQNMKWGLYPEDVIPAFIADMDFRIAPEIDAAFRKISDTADFGYPKFGDDTAEQAVGKAFAERMKTRFAWDVAYERTRAFSDLVQATYASIMAFSDPGDGVIVQVPNYPPFREAVAATGRVFVPLAMERTETGYAFDLATLEENLGECTKIMILCNPQNPTGRVFTRTELEGVLAFAEKHDLIVISDEIHADLVYPGASHIPFASLSPAAAARTVTLNSATKSFNIPGLRCSVIYFGSDALLERYAARLPGRLTGSANVAGARTTIAAWKEGQPWLDSVLSHLMKTRDHVAKTLAAEIPGIRFRVPEATYLLWLDCSELGIEGTAYDFFLDNARIGFSAGETFNPGAEKCVRMNFATTTTIMDEMLERMITAARANRR